jgi:hypothetical protein
MAVRAHREMIPRNVVGMHTHPSQSDPAMLEQLSKNITRQGITNSTLNYLRVSVWSESNQSRPCFGGFQRLFMSKSIEDLPKNLTNLSTFFRL